jgi:hypothetical protein
MADKAYDAVMPAEADADKTNEANKADGAIDANKANAAEEANVIGKIIAADEAILIEEDAFDEVVEAKGHG